MPFWQVWTICRVSFYDGLAGSWFFSFAIKFWLFCLTTLMLWCWELDCPCGCTFDTVTKSPVFFLFGRFIYSFMGVGILLCSITFIGCIAAEAINGCCLCFVSSMLKFFYLKIVVWQLLVWLLWYTSKDETNRMFFDPWKQGVSQLCSSTTCFNWNLLELNAVLTNWKLLLLF